ncbi:MAG: hypothetical protein IJ002_07205 [Clostridia bacterium]|nr:hypothetical protein [Clostridia bacterium]
MDRQEEKITPKYEPGDNFFKKFDNFWYHNKWKVIIIGFFVIVFIICAFQYCSREEQDIYIMYAGPKSLGQSYARSVKSALSEVVPDRNGDGRGSAEIVELWVASDEQIAAGKAELEEDGEVAVVNYDALSSNYEAFEQHMWAGDTIICLLDPTLYSTVYVEGDDGQMESGFMKLADVLGYTPEGAYDEYSIRIKDTPLGQYFTILQDIDTDSEPVLLCIRKKSSLASIFNQKETNEYHEYCTNVFKAIFEFEMK